MKELKDNCPERPGPIKSRTTLPVTNINEKRPTAAAQVNNALLKICRSRIFRAKVG